MNIIFDFDSTIIQLETIEVLADFALRDNENKNKILNKIKKLTAEAMSGDIPFNKALNERISLLKIKKLHVEKTTDLLKKKISYSFLSNLDFIKKNKNRCFIISGGFKEIISPILKPYGFKEKNIFANSFIYNDKDIVVGVDQNNPLSKDKGKNIAASTISGDNIIIGDGFTDYEIKKYQNAKIFILFTENIYRKEISEQADYIAKNFNQAFEYIKNV